MICRQSFRYAAAVVSALVVVAASMLAAVGAAAAVCPNEQLRLQLRSAQLPDCRAYELVTPAFKEGVAVGVPPLISADGTRVIAGGLGIFADAEGNTSGGIGAESGLGAYYELARGELGWTTTPVRAPPAVQFPTSGMQGDASPDLRTTLWKLRTPSLAEGVGDLYRREAGGSFVRLGPLQPLAGPPLFGNEGTYRGASQDLSHVFINKGLSQGRWPGDTTSGEESLYEYAGIEQSEPRLVGVKNSGPLISNSEAQLISNCETELGSGADAYNAISRDGTIVFFTARACGAAPAVTELYARIDERHTVALSEPVLAPGECTGPCEAAAHAEGVFQGASEDGAKAFFMTEQPLLNADRDHTTDLYMAEVAYPGVTRMVMVSEGETKASASENDATPGEGAGVLGVARVSQDGSHVYFVATGVLTKAANKTGSIAESGADNLYVFNTTTKRTAYVARLSEEDEGVWSRQNNGRPVAATPNGDTLVLVSRADLTDEGGVSGAQVFQYEAASGTLHRVSLGQHSTAPAFSPRIVELSYQSPSGDLPSRAGSTLTMSEDGAYVFFESPDALVPQALDDQVLACLFEFGGTCFNSVYAQNIYEYREGRVYLITSLRDKTGERAQRLLGTNASGQDVFFTTADDLVPQDTDTQIDIYDARAGGGFPAPARQPSCSGDACQGPLAAALVSPSPGSASQSAGDNLPPEAAALKAAPTSLTRAKMLARALTACKKLARRKRAACASRARKRYGAESRTSRHARTVRKTRRP